jgi:hypothetical protein
LGLPPKGFKTADESDRSAVVDTNTSTFVAVYGLGAEVDTNTKTSGAANQAEVTGVSDEVNDDTADEDPDFVSDTQIGDNGTAVDAVDTGANIRADNEPDTNTNATFTMLIWTLMLDTDANIAHITETETDTEADLGENDEDAFTVPETTVELEIPFSI